MGLANGDDDAEGGLMANLGFHLSPELLYIVQQWTAPGGIGDQLLGRPG